MINKIVEDRVDPTIMDHLRIQCENCRGLCCIVLYFTKMDGFPENKEAKVACHHLQENNRCRIYSSLALRGLKGCMAYDCFGAGQVVSQLVESKTNWNTLSSQETELIVSAYLAVMKIHQTLWYCSQCLTLRIPVTEKETAHRLIQQGKALISQYGLTLTSLHAQPFCDVANQYLKHVSDLILAYFPKSTRAKSQNYMGKNMSNKHLAGKDFSMSYLIAANLQGSNLEGVNFLGADLRDANICDTDLSQSLFLTQIQLNATKGNRQTSLPPFLTRPRSWNL